MVIFGQVFVATQALGCPLCRYEISDGPPKRFHEWDAGGDNAKVYFESGRSISHHPSYTVVFLTFEQKHFRRQPLQQKLSLAMTLNRRGDQSLTCHVLGSNFPRQCSSYNRDCGRAVPS